MIRTSIRLRRSALAAYLVLGFGALVLPTVAQAASADSRAKAEFRRGHKAYDLGHFQVALDAYTAAYDAEPLPALLFDIAQCHRHLGQYERAAFFFQRFLDKSGHSANTKAAQELLVEVRAKQDAQAKEAEADESLKREEELADARSRAARDEVAAAAQLRAEREALGAARSQEAAAPASPPVALDVAAQTPRTAGITDLGLAAHPSDSDPEASKSLVKKWWFWTAIAVGAVAAGTGAIYVASTPHAPTPSLGTIHEQ